MRYLSVCSGVEAASVAWHDLGWTPVGFSEIEPFPSAVLAHRFPSVKNYGDMTKYKEWDIEPGTVDVLVGGTPCQSFSVAGLRKGLEDPRGNLMLVYLGLAEHLRVPWLVWENVPGVLSSNGGRDFGTFLGELEQLGYRWSFRVLDAQHFGVPQRRRRVFVVAHLGDGPHSASVLFESESLRGDTAKGSKARKGSPRSAGKGAPSGGRIGVDIVGTLCSDTHPGAYSGQDAYTGRLVPQFFDEQASGSPYGTGSVASTCSTRDYKDATDLVVQPVCATGHRTHTLDRAHGATEDGTVRGTPIVPAIAFHPTQDPISSAEVTHALGTDFEVAGGLQPTLTMAVRRLLPVECERLQGFPDDHTNIPWRGKPAPDGSRYKAMGNSMAVPVMHWIGERLDRVAKGDR
jgi:DNA (cytosine-5)-methyltransferase 1